MGQTRSRRWLVMAITAASLVGGATFAVAVNPAPETYVFVARGDNPVDALAASSLAGRLNAPVVLTPPDTLGDDARASLLAADPDVVVIAGGTAAVSTQVQGEISGLLPDAKLQRVFGSTRYETAQELASLFGEIPASFLAIDGKANSADTADLAKDAERFGGLTSDTYQFSRVHREGAWETFPVPADDYVIVDILPPMTITVPEDGLLTTSMLVGQGSASTGTTFDIALVLVDYEGPIDDTDTLGLLNKLGGIFNNDSTWLPVPYRLSAGEHTVRVVGQFTNSELTPGEYTLGLRSLTATYSSQVDGQWEEFDDLPSTTTDAPESQMLRQLGRDD